jgi:radical SAM superfamily enzyme YgiQ (UPF0313 family)
MELVRMGVNVISFEDDDPTYDRDRTLALAETLAGVPAHYILHARVDELDNEVLKALASSGCLLIKLGVESGSADVIDRLKKGDGSTWVQRTIQATKAARELGMAVAGLFIVGCPDETEQDLARTKDLMLLGAFDLIQLHFFTPYPGSHIHGSLDTTLPEERAASLYHYDPHTLDQISFSELSPVRLREWSQSIYQSFVYRPGFIALHIRRFLPFYLHNPKVFSRLFGGFSKWTDRR